ncbi:MAG TPA: hypothetical protein VF271_00410 [Rhodanobacteraceae bacterium]
MIVSFTVLSLLGLVATALALSVKRIPEGEVYTLHRRHASMPQLLTAGTHWIMPLRDHIAHKISLAGRTLPLEIDDADASRARGNIYWQVLDPALADAVIDQADHLIRDEALQGLREGDDAARLKARLNDTLRPRGLLATRVDMHSAA